MGIICIHNDFFSLKRKELSWILLILVQFFFFIFFLVIGWYRHQSACMKNAFQNFNKCCPRLEKNNLKLIELYEILLQRQANLHHARINILHGKIHTYIMNSIRNELSVTVFVVVPSDISSAKLFFKFLSSWWCTYCKGPKKQSHLVLPVKRESLWGQDF